MGKPQQWGLTAQFQIALRITPPGSRPALPHQLPRRRQNKCHRIHSNVTLSLFLDYSRKKTDKSFTNYLKSQSTLIILARNRGKKLTTKSPMRPLKYSPTFLRSLLSLFLRLRPTKARKMRWFKFKKNIPCLLPFWKLLGRGSWKVPRLLTFQRLLRLSSIKNRLKYLLSLFRCWTFSHSKLYLW